MIVPDRPARRYAREAWDRVRDAHGYEASTHGRVRSYLLLGPHVGRPATIKPTPKLLKGSVSPAGYARVLLYLGGGKRRSVNRSVLVLETFVGPRPPGAHACHNDGDRSNNRLDNLRWDTQSGNFKDKMRHGTLRVAKLSEADIPPLWARLVAGERSATIARDFGLTSASIAAIKMGRCWSHITRHLPGWPIVPPSDPSAAVPVRVPRELADPSAEIWRPFPGEAGYRVSNRGRIATQWEIDRSGGRRTPVLSGRWRVLGVKLARNCQYMRFWLRSVSGRCRQHSVHAAVLLAFAGPRPPRFVACHDDGNPTNNDAANLRWDTHKGNRMDYLALKSGGAP